MKELKSEYVDSLPAKSDLVLKLAESESWVELESEFHKMKGTGKTYGLEEVSILGEKFENLVQSKQNRLEIAKSAQKLLTMIFNTHKNPDSKLKQSIILNLKQHPEFTKWPDM